MVTKGVVALVFIGVVVWYLAIYDSAANNDAIGGLRSLGEGISSLPHLLTGTASWWWPPRWELDSYRTWWDFLTSQGLVRIRGHVWVHVQLVGISMLAATVISVVLGIIGHRISGVGAFAVGAASVGLTIPSLALFAILIATPIGIGNTAPIIALTLYSILPILRNTLTGLNGVDQAILESAKGVGLSQFQRLYRIELPLAWPVILTGMRVATLLNIGIAAIAPLVGGGGLGFYINRGLTLYPQTLGITHLWTGVILTILFALAADALFTLLRHLTTSKGLQR